MIDFHSHILPEVDDGSASVEESAALLSMLSEQGVDVVAATPHFDPSVESPEHFLQRRKAAADKLAAYLGDAPHPRILLGAEVAYFSGISRMAALKDLRLEGSPILLLEMPMGRWSNYAVEELIRLSCYGGFRLLLAHVERYVADQPKAVWNKLLDHGILMQVNATCLLGVFSRGSVLRQLVRGEIHAIGSDCHNLKHRPPKMGEAMSVIRKRLGDEGESLVESLGRKWIDKRIQLDL